MRSEIDVANGLLAELEWLAVVVEERAAAAAPGPSIGALAVLFSGLDDPATVPELMAALGDVDLDGVLKALAPSGHADPGAVIRTLDEATRRVRRWLATATAGRSAEEVAALEAARASRKALLADVAVPAGAPASSSGSSIVFVLLLRDLDAADDLVERLEQALAGRAELVGSDLLYATGELHVHFSGPDPRAVAATAVPLLVPHIAERGSSYEWTDHDAPDGERRATRTEIEGLPS